MIQESLSGSPWDFGPVFAALAKPYTNEGQKEHTGHFQSHRTPSPSLSKVLSSHVDNDETLKATPADNSVSSLGDLSNALLCLGYSVQVTAPAAHDTGSLTTSDTDVNGLRDETSPREPGEEPNFEAVGENLGKKDLEDTRLAGKRAENGRRAVLQSFLGSFANSSQKGSVPQKSSKQKINGVTDHKNATLSFATPNLLSSPRKRVNMHLSAEKKIQLTLELHKRFPESRDSFYNSENIPGSIAVTDPGGIHVFVDISNVCVL